MFTLFVAGTHGPLYQGFVGDEDDTQRAVRGEK